MYMARREQQTGSYGTRAFLVPVVWIVLLITAYYLLTDWRNLPGLASEIVTAIQ